LKSHNKTLCNTVLSAEHGGEFIVNMMERGYSKFRRQICLNYFIDNDECNAEIAETFEIIKKICKLLSAICLKIKYIMYCSFLRVLRD